MEQAARLYKFLVFILVTSVTFACYKYFSKPVTVETEIEPEPSYSHSLKINKKVLRSYRSPAAARKFEKSQFENSSFTNPGNSSGEDYVLENDSSLDSNPPSKRSKSETLSTENFRARNVPESLPPSRSQETTAAQTAQNNSGITGTFIPNLAPRPAVQDKPKDETSSSSGSAPAVGVPETNTPKISGKVKPLMGVITSLDKFSVIDSAWAANTCTSPRILLFDLTNMSILLDNPLSDAILSGETKFNFDPMALGLDLSNPKRYMLHTWGCSTNFKKIITSFYKDQDIDLVTTFLSTILNSEDAPALGGVTAEELETLYTAISGSTPLATEIENIFTTVSSNPTLVTLLENHFNPGSLGNFPMAAPDLNNVDYDTTLQEGTPFSYNVEAFHWSSTYEIAYEWKIDGVTVSTNPNWVYTPGPNSPGTQTITLIVGKKDSPASTVDLLTPYHEINWDITISNNVPPVAPVVAFDPSVTDPSATRNISFTLTTGAACDTFSAIAIKENGETPAPADFTYVCGNAPDDTINYSINEPLDGQVTINFWSIDAAGVISSTSTDLSLVIDTTPPVIELVNLQSGYASAEAYVFEWKLTEMHSSSAQNFTVEFYNGTSWSTVGTEVLTDGPHNETVFSRTITLPNINIANGRVRISYVDLLGFSTTVTSDAFAINRPALGSSPASLDLGSVLNKGTSSTLNFTFTNSGLVPSKTCGTPVIGGANASEFTLVSDGCDTTAIAAGGSCPMSVRATPQSKGTRAATILIICGGDSYSTNLTIDSLNNVPVTANISQTTIEDTFVTINFGSISDVDGDSLLLSFPSNPANGTVDNCGVVSGEHVCRYTPNLNFNGTDTFTYKTNDGTVDSTTRTVTVTVMSQNDAPTLAGTLSLTLNEDTLHNFNLVAGADLDGDTITYVITAGPTHGTLSCPVLTSTACSYSPNLNYNGTDSFTYRVTDGTLNSATITASITINAINDAPVAPADQNLATRDNFAYNFSISAGSDVDNLTGTLTYKLITGPATGTLSNCITTAGYSGDLTCTYTAPAHFHGSVVFTYLVYDGSLESSGFTTVTIDVSDQTPTTPSLSAVNFTSTVVTPNSPLTMTAASCSDISAIMIQESSTAPTAGAAGWQPCSTVAAAMTFNPSTSNQQGFRTLRIYGKDPHDNISTPQLLNFIFDSLAPQISIENVPTLPNGIAYPLKWRLTEASVTAAALMKLEYSLDNGTTWTTEANIPVGQDGPHSSTLYTYNWNVPAGTHPNTLVRVSLTDNTSLTGTATSNNFQILVDLNSPNLLAGQMTINGSSAPSPTPQKYVNVSLKAIDGDTNITHFCLKTNNTPPAVTDECWRAVDAPQPGLTPAPTLNLANFPFLLGFTPAIYDVYAWTKDLSGNISTNTGTVGHDLVSIEYFSDLPPTISNFFVSNTLTPNNPITADEMEFDSGDPVIIKWRAVDDKGILSTIRLAYTTDDVTYTEFATSLSNTKNNCDNLDEGGTSLDDDSTGCYSWTSPVANTQYFKVQLIIEDNANQATSTTSLPLNSSRFKVLAGNIDPGVLSSAKSAIIAAPGIPALHSLAVASDGKIFIRDANFGLMYINPVTGIYEQLLRVTGASTGDLGPVRSATAQGVIKITMDYQDRLIIWDNDRIRRVDTKTEPMQIETIIGAQNNGAPGTETTDIVTDPRDLSINPGIPQASIFQALPNGDIYFQANSPHGTVDSGNTLRIYRGSLPAPTINTIRISGSGTAEEWNGPISMTSDSLYGYAIGFDVNSSALNKIMAKLARHQVGCSFYSHANIDLTSYVATAPHPPAHVSTCGDYATRSANDGSILHINSGLPWGIQVSRYDAATNTNVKILGSGAQGYCSDGTAALSCNLMLSDIFITAAGKMFFIDNGLVRVVDEAGLVQTLYGQTKTYGDYGLAQDARFHSIGNIDHGVGDDVIVYDEAEKIIREIRPNHVSSQVVRVAGNGMSDAINFGIQASLQSLNGASWNQPGNIATDRTTGDIYFACTWGAICKLTRSTGLWEMYTGGGANTWLTTGDLGRLDVALGGYTPTILGNYGGRFVTGSYSWSGATSQHAGLRETNIATGVSTFLAGKAELDGASGCADGDGTDCNLNAASSHGRAVTWHTGLGVWLYEQGTTLRTLQINNPNGLIGTFATLTEGIQSMVWNGTNLYYCSNDGLLKKIDYSTSSLTTLPFPSSGIRCYGQNILYKNASGSKPARLVFPFSQNGLSGVGEYLNP